jgi:hypothetical protein
MTGGGESIPMPIWKTIGCSAIAACTAEIATLPIDTAKVRLQIQASPAAGMKPKYSGMVGTLAKIAKEEGFGALWAGLTPGLHRCACQRACISTRSPAFPPLLQISRVHPNSHLPRLFVGVVRGIT